MNPIGLQGSYNDRGRNPIHEIIIGHKEILTFLFIWKMSSTFAFVLSPYCSFFSIPMASQDSMKPTGQLSCLGPLFATDIIINKHRDLQFLSVSLIFAFDFY